MVKICLIGKAGAGKTTVLNYLVKTFGFTPLKIAAPIYEIATKYFGMVGKDRALLQKIGNSMRELVNQDIWINGLLDKSVDLVLNQKLRNLVVDDCRFKNEFNKFKQDGWISIALECPEEVRLSRMTERDGDTQKETLNDVSELEVDEILGLADYKIDTSGNYEDNYIKLNVIIGQILGQRHN